MNLHQDFSKIIAILFAVVVVIGIFLYFPISNQISSYNYGVTALKNWDVIELNVTSTQKGGHGDFIILNNYTYKNLSYSNPELYCYGNCTGKTEEILVNPSNPTQSVDKEIAMRDRDLNSNPFVSLFNVAGFCCIGIPVLILIIIVLYNKTRIQK